MSEQAATTPEEAVEPRTSDGIREAHYWADRMDSFAETARRDAGAAEAAGDTARAVLFLKAVGEWQFAGRALRRLASMAAVIEPHEAKVRELVRKERAKPARGRT